MDYTELLQKNEWEIKCNEILQRDHFICQDCGRVGLHNNSYFKINNFDDLEQFFSDSFIKELADLSNTINPKLKATAEINLSEVSLIDKSYLYHFFCPDDIFSSSIYFYSNKKLECTQDIKFHRETYTFICNSYKFETGIIIYLLEDTGSTNSIYFKYNWWEEGLHLIINLNNIIFDIYTPKHMLSEQSPLFKNITTLQIHHKYYINDHMPWEYNNDALVTLCPECHQKRHLYNKVPLFSNDKRRTIVDNLPVCDRCNGTGYLPQYHYHFGGVCFKCNGEGVCGY